MCVPARDIFLICPSKRNCPKCNGRHHFMLCFANKKYNQTASGANGIPLGARKPATVTNPVLVEFEGHSSEEMGHEHSSSEICGPVHQSGEGKKKGPRPTAYLMVDVFNRKSMYSTIGILKTLCECQSFLTQGRNPPLLLWNWPQS